MDCGLHLTQWLWPRPGPITSLISLGRNSAMWPISKWTMQSTKQPNSTSLHSRVLLCFYSSYVTYAVFSRYWPWSERFLVDETKWPLKIIQGHRQCYYTIDPWLFIPGSKPNFSITNHHLHALYIVISFLVLNGFFGSVSLLNSLFFLLFYLEAGCQSV